MWGKWTADLDQALQQAMQAVGQKPVPLQLPHKPAADADAGEKQQMRQRINQLEGMLAQAQASL